MLLALVLVDLGYDLGRWRGVAIGVAAGVKLTPLIFIPYLWLIGRRRAAIAGLVRSEQRYSAKLVNPEPEKPPDT